jgi:hypothetical protein
MKSMVMGLLIACTLIGCATIERNATLDKEQMLAAAGFRMKLADTPEKLAKLQALPQQQLMARAKDDKIVYFYADAATCQCLYLGNEKAYQRYQKLAVEKQIANEQAMAAQTNMDMEMDWGMLGPWGGDPYWY